MIGTRTIRVNDKRLWRRVPLVLALTLGLLMSLLQCVDCCSAFASDNTSVTSALADDGASPNGPDQSTPVHSCHCLCHISAQTAAVLSSPADLPLRVPAFAGDQSPASLAGLPLYEPPRA
jgi:hypothetical protein